MPSPVEDHDGGWVNHPGWEQIPGASLALAVARVTLINEWREQDYPPVVDEDPMAPTYALGLILLCILVLLLLAGIVAVVMFL